LQVDPVKLICLKLPVNVGTDAPDVRLILSLLLVVAPPVLPKLNVLVTDIAALIFDVPVNVKFVAVAIDRLVRPTDAASTIEPVEPKAIARVFIFDDSRILVVRVKPFRSNVPTVKLQVLILLFVVVVNASCSVVVIPKPLTVNTLITLPFDVSVPSPTVVKLLPV